MSTPAQAAANRANAKKSTGPRTASGKAIAARNARRHGLSARTLHIPEERRAEFDDLRTGYELEIMPVGTVQQELFDQLVFAAWNLRLARELHASALAQNEPNSLDRLQRYLQMHERSYHRAIKQMRAIQTDRAIRCLPPHQHFDHLPDTVDVRPLLRAMAAQAQKVEFQPSAPLSAPSVPPPAPRASAPPSRTTTQSPPCPPAARTASPCPPDPSSPTPAHAPPTFHTKQ